MDAAEKRKYLPERYLNARLAVLRASAADEAARDEYYEIEKEIYAIAHPDEDK